MDSELLIKDLKEKFGTAILETVVRNENRITVTIHPDILLKIAEYLIITSGFRFIIATGLHTKKGFEILYHISKDQTGLILNIHVVLDSEEPKVESLSNMLEGANWIEREMHELLGINFLNHPNQEKLISEGNWAEGVYPLRKKFK